MARNVFSRLGQKLVRTGILLGAVTYCWAAPGWSDSLFAQEQQSPVPAESGKVPVEGDPKANLANPALGTETAAETAAEEAADDGPPAWSLTDLFQEGEYNWMTANQLKVGGSTVASYTFNFRSPSDKFNGPVTWTDRSNEFQLNQQWLYLERATDTTEKDWDLGGRVDMLYGTNYRWATSAGLEDRWSMNTNQQFYGMALPQLYAEAAYKNVKVKAGHFVSPVGYFTVDTSQNFFNTLPYTYQYGEPFTHTGALATVSLTDNLTVGSGFIRGWDNWDAGGAGSPNLGYLGTATYTFEDKSTLALVVVWSREFNNRFTPDGDFDFSSRYFQTLVYSRQLTENINYVFQSDFGNQGTTSDFSGTREIGNANWYGINQYLFYKQNDCWTWGANFEWFRDQNGYRVGSVLPTFTTPTSQTRGLPADRYGYQGNFFQVTVGPKWTPNKNLFIRPNLRFDWFSGDNLNATQQKPYGDGEDSYQTILGTDIGIVY